MRSHAVPGAGRAPKALMRDAGVGSCTLMERCLGDTPHAREVLGVPACVSVRSRRVSGGDPCLNPVLFIISP